MFALVTGFPLFIGLVKGSISFLCLISVTPIMLLLSGRSHVRCLYTVLLALSGSCSFILVLCGVEFVAQGESYLSELGYIIAHSAYSAVYQYVRIVGFQKVVVVAAGGVNGVYIKQYTGRQREVVAPDKCTDRVVQ